MNETMELHHCKTCDQDKPGDEMRRDSNSPTGFRQQCKACKQEADRKRDALKAPKPTSSAKTASKSAPPKKAAAKKAVPAAERLYTCNRCKNPSIPFQAMTKDRRKFMGVGSWCLECRRERESELKAAAEAEKVAEANAKKDPRRFSDEWEFCYKCNAQARPGVLKQPPAYVAAGYPDDATLCSKCLSRAGDREDMVRAERKRLGIPDKASRKDLESAARVAALRELALKHETEYRGLFQRYMVALGVESEKKWITL